MFDHLSLGVRNLAKARRFYDALLGPLGHEVAKATETELAYGPGGTGARFFLYPVARGRVAGRGAHVAFGAVSREAVDRAYAGAMKAGDATFHTGWALHGAPGNNSAATREVMTIIYFADGTRVGHTDNPSRESDLRAWLPGLQPGDLAASELNPLLYSQS